MMMRRFNRVTSIDSEGRWVGNSRSRDPAPPHPLAEAFKQKLKGMTVAEATAWLDELSAKHEVANKKKVA